MSLKSSIVAQFGKPSGLWGALAGRIMASRPSNRFRNARTVELLQLTPVSRVLEIGCGPGLALANCAQIITSGRIVGLDHSGVMIRQARDRLERAGAAHRAELVEGGIDRLRDWPEAFDQVFSLNVIQFQDDKLAFYRAVHAVLVNGGACLTTYQPRLSKDAAGAARSMISTIECALADAGFADVSTVEIIGGDAPAGCVLGYKPST
jgi:ubiquinone/menaquinone biosynthesis C-methylase UbiE